ncbi:hypothetical protein HDU96_009076 [Phlyctochytrium bullatum]|nr:hypothetical protein HDU96_009076 [Phlyctochytrium bullatum]
MTVDPSTTTRNVAVSYAPATSPVAFILTFLLLGLRTFFNPFASFRVLQVLLSPWCLFRLIGSIWFAGCFLVCGRRPRSNPLAGIRDIALQVVTAVNGEQPLKSDKRHDEETPKPAANNDAEQLLPIGATEAARPNHSFAQYRRRHLSWPPLTLIGFPLHLITLVLLYPIPLAIAILHARFLAILFVEIVAIFYILILRDLDATPPAPPHPLAPPGAVPIVPPKQYANLVCVKMQADRIRELYFPGVPDGSCSDDIVRAAVPAATHKRFWTMYSRDEDAAREALRRESDAAAATKPFDDVFADPAPPANATCDTALADDLTTLYLNLTASDGVPQCPPRAAPPTPHAPVVFVTYATGCSQGLNRLAAQLAKANIPLHVLGLGRTWRGWGHRIRSYHDHLITLHPSTLVVLSDGNDVLLNPVCDAKELVRRWYTPTRWPATAPIVVAAERACWPDTHLASKYGGEDLRAEPKGTDPLRKVRHHRVRALEAARVARNWMLRASNHPPDDEPLLPTLHVGNPDNSPSMQYLNGGAQLGLAGDLVRLFRNAYVDECYDDQLALTERYLAADAFWVDDAEDPQRVEAIEKAMATVWQRERRLVEAVEKELGGGAANATEVVPTPFRVHPTRAAANPVLAMPAEASARLRKLRAELEAARADLAKRMRERDAMAQVALRRVQPRPPRGLLPEPGAPVPVPGHARPAMALDVAQDFTAALFSVRRGDLDVVDGRRVVMRETGGVPCFVHQNSDKRDNSVLEEVAEDLGVWFRTGAREKAERFRERRKWWGKWA